MAQIIKETKATIFLGAPSMYRLFNELPDKHIPDLSSLHFCISGGDALPAEVMEQFEKKYNILIYEGDKKEITSFCSKHLGRHEIPRIVEFVPELPKTPTGKVLKRLLRSGRKPLY